MTWIPTEHIWHGPVQQPLPPQPVAINPRGQEEFWRAFQRLGQPQTSARDANGKTANDYALEAHQLVDALERSREGKLRKEKDAAYRERNQLAAALARAAIAMGFRAGVGEHPESDKEWEPDWRTILFIDLPTGQLSWHFHDSEWPLLAGLPRYSGNYDGHSTTEKYRRLMCWQPRPQYPDVAPAESAPTGPYYASKSARND
jgi:hypothetical protein